MLTPDEEITAWLDDELPEEDAARLASRYDADPDFAARVDSLRGVDRLVRLAVPEEDLPAELIERLGLANAARPNVVRFQSNTKPRQAAHGKRRWAANDLGRMAAGVAILLGLGVGVGTLVDGGQDGTPPAEYRTLGDAPSGVSANGMIMFAPGVRPEQASAVARSAGATLIGGPGDSGAWKLAVPAERRDAILESLRSDPRVIMAEPIDGDGE